MRNIHVPARCVAQWFSPIALLQEHHRNQDGLMEANRSEARVTIAHDWLMSYAGSERCVVEMIDAYPNARLLTTLVRFEALPTSLL